MKWWPGTKWEHFAFPHPKHFWMIEGEWRRGTEWVQQQYTPSDVESRLLTSAPRSVLTRKHTPGGREGEGWGGQEVNNRRVTLPTGGPPPPLSFWVEGGFKTGQTRGATTWHPYGLTLTHLHRWTRVICEKPFFSFFIAGWRSRAWLFFLGSVRGSVSHSEACHRPPTPSSEQQVTGTTTAAATTMSTLWLTGAAILGSVEA